MSSVDVGLTGRATVTTSKANEILLVKAIEETRATEIGGERLIDAITAGGDLRDAGQWLSRRAEFLLDTDLSSYRPLLALGRPPRLSVFASIAASFAVGVLFQLLDPRSDIHVLFNPVTLLCLWNVGVYGLLVVRGFLPGLGIPKWRRPTPLERKRASDEPRLPKLRGLSLLVRPLVSSMWWLRQKLVVKTTRARDVGRVVWAFAPDWIECTWPKISLLARRALTLGSIGLVLGAFAGMYARGLGLEYNFVWRSTFITDPDTITRLLKIVFGPPAWILGSEPPGLQTTELLLSVEGMKAGYWIHLYAVLAFFLVALPRTVMAVIDSFRLRRGASDLEIDLDDPYFRELLVRARRYRLEKVTKEIKTIVEVEAGKLSEGVAVFVANSLYDERIVPRLRAYRQEGGRIADLKADLEQECTVFESPLQRYLDDARGDFESSIASKVQGILRVDRLAAETTSPTLKDSIRSAAGSSAAGVGGSMGTGVVDPVALAVSSALALVAGSVSGGFGQSLGAALLVGLGASGPVGFLIGALAALVAAGGAYWLGREKVASTVEQVRLPATVIKTVLWSNRLDKMIADGRVKCVTQVKELMASQLAPLPERLSNEIWTTVKPLLGDELREALPRSEAPQH